MIVTFAARQIVNILNINRCNAELISRIIFQFGRSPKVIAICLPLTLEGNRGSFH